MGQQTIQAKEVHSRPIIKAKKVHECVQSTLQMCCRKQVIITYHLNVSGIVLQLNGHFGLKRSDLFRLFILSWSLSSFVLRNLHSLSFEIFGDVVEKNNS